MTHGKVKVMCYTTADVYPDSMQDHFGELVVGLEQGVESPENLVSILRVVYYERQLHAQCHFFRKRKLQLLVGVKGHK